MYKYKTRVYLIVFPKEKAIQDCLETDSPIITNIFKASLHEFTFKTANQHCYIKRPSPVRSFRNSTYDTRLQTGLFQHFK